MCSPFFFVGWSLFQSLSSALQNYDALDDEMFSKYNLTTIMDKFTNQKFSNPDDSFIPAISNSSLYYIINEYYEYQLGDWVISHINNDQRLSYHIDDTNHIGDGVRSIPKGDLIQSIDIPKDVVISEGADPGGGGSPPLF